MLPWRRGVTKDYRYMKSAKGRNEDSQERSYEQSAAGYSQETIEIAIDELARAIGYNVLKEQNITGHTYTLINKDDTWFYLLSQHEGTEH